MFRSSRRGSGLGMVLLLLGASLSEAATPSVESVHPAVGQRGSEFSLNLIGAGLDDVDEVLFYRKGVICTALKSASENELTLTLRAAPDCPLGSHGFRLRSRRGLSELRIFRITAYPVVKSLEPNNSIQTAHQIDTNVTITGVLESGDVDYFRVSLKRGEAFSAEVEAVRLGANLLDTVLTIRDPAGHPLVTVDDTPLFRQDPFATVVAPRDGEYTIELREVNNEGDDNARYALHLGRFPRPAAIYPAGGPQDESTVVRFLGDASGEWTQTITPSARFELFAERDGLLSPTPHPFRVSSFPNVLEADAASQPATLPIAFNGRIQGPEETDSFAFTAEAGQSWQFDLFAERIGSPLDAVMTITDVAGTVLARGDDYDSHDPRLLWTAPQSGTYKLTVSDKRKSGGPLFVYRVEVSHATPQLTAFLPRPNRLSQERQTIVVPQGNRVVTFIAAQRKQVAGPLRITAESLPEGVSLDSGALADDQFWTPVVLEATNQAPIGGCLASLEVSGQTNGRSIFGGFQQVIDLVNGPADALYQAYIAERVAVAVTEAVPFRVHLDPPATGLSQDGTLALRVRVERQNDFKTPLEITLPFLPPWVDGPDKLTIAGHETEGVYVLRAWSDATSRTWPVCVEAKPGLTTTLSSDMPMIERGPRRRRSHGGSLDTRVSSALVDLSIIAPPVTGPKVSIAGEPGKVVRMIFRLETIGELPEMMVATLEGLPNRVTAEPVLLTRNEREIEFAIRLADDAPIGEFPGLVCRLSGRLNEQTVSYCIGRDSVLEIAPQGKLVTGADGRPLSRLEVLRRQKTARPNSSSDQ